MKPDTKYALITDAMVSAQLVFLFSRFMALDYSQPTTLLLITELELLAALAPAVILNMKAFYDFGLNFEIMGILTVVAAIVNTADLYWNAKTAVTHAINSVMIGDVYER